MAQRSKVVTAALLLALAGCGHTPPKPRERPEPPWHPATAMLLPYAGPDGSLTRAQMEAGLRRDFAKVDAGHKGCLDDDEVREINEQRWKEDASTASPLIDFKHNGCVDFDEFAAVPRSLFDQLDRNGDGKLSADELKPGSKPGTDQQNQPDASGHGHRHGSGNGEPPGN